MHVVVTGANGFIGQHVVRALLAARHTVTGLDLTGPTLEQVKADSTILWADDLDITKPLRRIYAVDAVIHLAAIANPRGCDADPANAFNINVNGTHNVLQMALESGARKFVFASSAHVYGISPKYLPTDENHPLWFQNNVALTQRYTLTKILGEKLCDLYYSNFGLSYTALRIFNIYGPGQAPGYFVPDMIAKAKAGNIELKGANTTKDWVYVDDAVRALLLALETPFVGAVNIGSGVETTLGTIASIIAEGMGATFSSQVDSNPTRMRADIRCARRVLRWEPNVSVREGIHAVVRDAKVKEAVA